MRLTAALIALLGALTPVLAAAEIVIRFVEDAPYDRFEIENDSACDPGEIDLGINLYGAAEDLYFDASPGGAGAAAHHPVELIEGAQHIGLVTPVADGDRAISLSLMGILPWKSVVIAADIDRRAAGDARLIGDGIEGARAVLMSRDSGFEASGRWGADGVVRLASPPC